MSSQQLAKLDFMTNIPQTLTFPYGDCKYIASRTKGWAPSFLYTVIGEDDVTYAWFASEYAHTLIQEAGIGKGGIATVTRGEVKGDDGKMRARWSVEAIDTGEPVATPVRGAPSDAQQPATASAAPAAAPGSRQGAEERLAILGAAYTACVDESKGVWARGSAGIEGVVDHETIHSTASSLFITLMREGYDVSVFASTFGESPGLAALRKLIERIRIEPYLADVRSHFNGRLNAMPREAAQQRALYAELYAAVKAATMAAADQTTNDEDFPEDVDFAAAPAAKATTATKATVQDDATPEHVEAARQAVLDTWPNEPDMEVLNMLLSKITRTDNASLDDLTAAQSKVLVRSLANIKSRGA